MIGGEAGRTAETGPASPDPVPQDLAAHDLAAQTFEELVDALETITRQMAGGDIGIEVVADLYEQAGRLHAEASERLERVRVRIESLADAPVGGASPADP